jgi:hypothetical protein
MREHQCEQGQPSLGIVLVHVTMMAVPAAGGEHGAPASFAGRGGVRSGILGLERP